MESPICIFITSYENTIDRLLVGVLDNRDLQNGSHILS